jgi:hypothetical protein
VAKKDAENINHHPTSHLNDIKKRSIGTITDMIAAAIHHLHHIGGGVIQKRVTAATKRRATKRRKTKNIKQERNTGVKVVDHRPILRLHHQLRRHHRELMN